MYIIDFKNRNCLIEQCLLKMHHTPKKSKNNMTHTNQVKLIYDD